MNWELINGPFAEIFAYPECDVPCPFEYLRRNILGKRFSWKKAREFHDVATEGLWNEFRASFTMPSREGWVVEREYVEGKVIERAEDVMQRYHYVAKQNGDDNVRIEAINLWEDNEGWEEDEGWTEHHYAIFMQNHNEYMIIMVEQAHVYLFTKDIVLLHTHGEYEDNGFVLNPDEGSNIIDMIEDKLAIFRDHFAVDCTSRDFEAPCRQWGPEDLDIDDV